MVFCRYRKVSLKVSFSEVPPFFGADHHFPATREHQDSVAFRQFRRQLLHTSIARILLPLKEWMTKPKITRCADGHWRRVVYGLGPYIADYPEQCVLACVVSGWCARCLAKADDIDGNPRHIQSMRSHEHTEGVRAYAQDNLKSMWDGWGIIGDVVVSRTFFSLSASHAYSSLLAVYDLLPARRHPRIDVSRHPSPAREGVFQGSLGDLGRATPGAARRWEGFGGRDGSTVSCPQGSLPPYTHNRAS